MRNNTIITLLLIPHFFWGCFLRAPSATMTDQYVWVRNPGQYWGLSEVQAVEMDSLFNYPSKEEYLVSYSVVKRKNNKQVEGYSNLKAFFRKKNNRYYWKVRRMTLLADYKLNDTISLKPYTWYKLSTERYNFIVYFYWNGSKGDYILKEKPKPGAW